MAQKLMDPKRDPKWYVASLTQGVESPGDGGIVDFRALGIENLGYVGLALCLGGRFT